MSLPATRSSTSKDIYHQVLPRFILRQFSFVPSSGLRQKVRNSWRTCSAPSERLLVYDLAAGRLSQRVPKDGRLDIFKDIQNSTEVEHIESELKGLEDEAATIVRAIHYRLQTGTVTLSRARLSILRKFLLVTHYRRQVVHFQEAGVETTLPTPLQCAWLQGLKYYLETPHHDMIATVERLRERYGPSRLSEMLKNHSYPEDERLYFQYAIEYEDLANNYFLGVWVASEESEFVISGQAFSHWEGHIDGTLPAHRVFILTPRIAIILRSTYLHNPNFNHPSILHSALADVSISKPLTRYAKEDLIDILESLEADPAQAKLVIDDYRATPEAEQDSFRFSFTQLSPEQTYAVNEVIMMRTNLQYHGSIVFRQPSVMRETTGLYMASPTTYPYLGGKQKLFYPLLVQLAELECSQQGPSSPPVGENESTVDCQLSLLLGFMIQNHITFPSSYTRAILTFHMATAASSSNPISQRMCQIQDAAVDKLRSLLDPPLPEVLQDGSYTGLVRSLDNDESEIFFSLMSAFMDQANVAIPGPNDFVATIIHQAAIIGVTYWLAEERPDVLRDGLSPWVRVLA